MASRLERLISLDAHIRSGVHPGVEQLCRLFEVQPRTIYQDLKELREKFGLDIRFNREVNGYFNANPTKRLPSMAISDDEVLLLIVASELLAHQGGPSFRGGLANVIQNLLSSSSKDLSARVQRKISFVGSTDNVSRSLFVTLLQACIADLRVNIVYRDPESDCAADMLLEPKKIIYDFEWKLLSTVVATGVSVLILLNRVISCELNIDSAVRQPDPPDEDPGSETGSKTGLNSR